MSFDQLGLSEPLLRAVADQGYTIPTPIQAESIPAVLSGSDVMATAQTGTGKTAGYALPLLQNLSYEFRKQDKPRIRALIMTPTRELADQVCTDIQRYGEHLHLRCTAVFGGVNIKSQKIRLKRGVDILVATPGRLLDLKSQGCVDLSGVEILVLDEADRMLDMGFYPDIKKIIQMMPTSRQNLLYSATLSEDIRELSAKFMNNPITLDMAGSNNAAETVTQKAYRVSHQKKIDFLLHLIKEESWQQALVFTRTKRGAEMLSNHLNKVGLRTTAIHGDKSQFMRKKALTDFKTGKVDMLIATDVAARGLDIKQLPRVVNFEMPHVAEDYIHRIGRTGRAGQLGLAISFVGEGEVKLIREIEKLLGVKIELHVVPGFAPPKTSDSAPGGHRKPKSSFKKPYSATKGGNSGGSGGKPAWKDKTNKPYDSRPPQSGKRNPFHKTAKPAFRRD